MRINLTDARVERDIAKFMINYHRPRGVARDPYTLLWQKTWHYSSTNLNPIDTILQQLVTLPCGLLQAIKRLETLVVAGMARAAHPKEHLALLNTLIDVTRELQARAGGLGEGRAMG